MLFYLVLLLIGCSKDPHVERTIQPIPVGSATRVDCSGEGAKLDPERCLRQAKAHSLDPMVGVWVEGEVLMLDGEEVGVWPINKDDQRGVLHSRLFEQLQLKADAAKVLAKADGDDGSQFKGRLSVDFPPTASTADFRSVLYTAGQAQFSELYLGNTARVGWVGPVTLPTIGPPKPALPLSPELALGITSVEPFLSLTPVLLADGIALNGQLNFYAVFDVAVLKAARAVVADNLSTELLRQLIADGGRPASSDRLSYPLGNVGFLSSPLAEDARTDCRGPFSHRPDMLATCERAQRARQPRALLYRVAGTNSCTFAKAASAAELGPAIIEARGRLGLPEQVDVVVRLTKDSKWEAVWTTFSSFPKESQPHRLFLIAAGDDEATLGGPSTCPDALRSRQDVESAAASWWGALPYTVAEFEKKPW